MIRGSSFERRQALVDTSAYFALVYSHGLGAIVMEEVTDPDELARAQAQRERFDRNVAWLQAHGAEVYPRHRGKFLCIAGEELFVADTAEEALARGAAAHPDDDGSFVHYVPAERLPRIYAH